MIPPKKFLNVFFVACFWYLIDPGTGCFLTGSHKSYLSGGVQTKLVPSIVSDFTGSKSTPLFHLRS